jgi:hypothetical protein
VRKQGKEGGYGPAVSVMFVNSGSDHINIYQIGRTQDGMEKLILMAHLDPGQNYQVDSELEAVRVKGGDV